jgi:flagellar protein FliS
VSSKTDTVRLQYIHQKVLTASREKLLLLTFEIAIDACCKAGEMIRTKDFQGSNDALKTAQKAIRELQFALRPDKAEELADNLNRLYDFMHQELVEANVKKDVKKIEGVQRMLEDLAGAWRDAVEAAAEEIKNRPVNRQTVGSSLDISY